MPAGDTQDILDHYLAEQQNLSAVERFSQWHDDAESPTETQPAQAQYYSSLIPTTLPQAGQQYAFEVDLDACSGCKACVVACHNLNGLDEQETWRDVGLLIGGTSELPVLQHVTTACHHCLEPPCMKACPVDAYEKDPVTGIVRHLDDQCFGCQYCTLACPYEAPKYHSGKGIVRKCDMCSDRLAEGEAPACVQACPNEAIRIDIVNHHDVVAESEANLFLPGAHEPQYTLPTTRYKSEQVLPRNLLPADYYSVKKQHAHWPLVVMLVLTQLSVGAFVLSFLQELWQPDSLNDAFLKVHATTALGVGLLALNASLFHLGRPQYAFRAFIGLKHSWLSREIVVFGLFAPLAMGYAGLLWWQGNTNSFVPLLAMLVAFSGFLGVFCSIRIYECTRRVFWNPVYTGTKFLGTTLLLGLSTTLLTSIVAALVFEELSVSEITRSQGQFLCRVLMIVTGIKLGFEALIFGHLRDRPNTPMKRTARLMTGELSRITTSRFACGIIGGLLVPAWLLSTPGTTATVIGVVLVFLFTLTGELLERTLFFAAVIAPKMPGGLTP